MAKITHTGTNSLTYIFTLIKQYVTGIASKKVDKVDGKQLSTNDYTTAEKNKLAGVATGAQVNVIESIKVNGVTQNVVDKAVDIKVEAGSNNNLTNALKANYDAAYTHSQQPHAPADAQANVIETIKVNTVVLKPTGKAIDISVPTKTSQLTNDSKFLTSIPAEYITETELNTALGNKVDKVTGKGLSTNDLTATLKGNYDAAYTHSTTAHAPSNAQVNVIEKINVNGVALVPTSKAVSITVPTKTSEITNDSGFLTAVPAEYVTDTELTGKGYQTSAQVESAITGKGYQTAAQVDSAIQKVVAAAPAALDTLNEIAAALNNDANFAGTMTTELSKKANTADFAELTNQEIETIWNSVTA